MTYSTVKAAVIGAGSFVFGPSVLHQAIFEERLDGLELALVDVDAASLEMMAALGRRMAREAGVDVRISAHTDRRAALDGASFVICCAAPDMRARHQTDYAIIQRHLPGHMITEFGGVAGISYSLRQIAFIRGLAADMRRLCPEAWLLSVSNPLPRVCQAAAESGVRTAGFCAVSLAGYGMAAQLLGMEAESYPWTATRAQLRAKMAGLNHFCWLVDLCDAATGEDLLPALRCAAADGHTAGSPVCENLLRETGYLLVPHDDHVADFLSPDPRRHYHPPYHGDAAERQARWIYLQAAARGDAPLNAVTEHEAWEKPMAFVAGAAFGATATLHSLNLVNVGQIPNLPRGVFVETPCVVTSDGPQPTSVTLPDAVVPYCQRTALITDTIVRGGMTGDRGYIHAAVELDPTIVDKAAGLAAIDECLAAHADLH
jgi:alpha-galactosidase/6-phospho-beta-glucosidase family protein